MAARATEAGPRGAAGKRRRAPPPTATLAPSLRRPRPSLPPTPVQPPPPGDKQSDPARSVRRFHPGAKPSNGVQPSNASAEPRPARDTSVSSGCGQRLAGIAKFIGDRIAAVAPEIPARHLDAGRGLPALVFGDVEQTIDPRHHVTIEARPRRSRPAALRARPAARGSRPACHRAATNPGRSGFRAAPQSAAG